MKNRKLSFFIGLTNIASFIPPLKLELINAGHDCYSAYQKIYNNNNKIISPSKPDFHIASAQKDGRLQNLSSRLITFKQAISKCDIFIFFWSSFTDRGLDLRILSALGKKIIFVATGEEIRWPNATNQDFVLHNMSPTEYGAYAKGDYKMLNRKLQKLRNFEMYSTVIFSRKDQAQLQLRSYIPLIGQITPSTIINNYNQRRVPKIIHAPSNKKIKGTSYVLDTITRLRNEGVLFDFEKLENVDHEKALQLYSDADIVIDQLFLPGGGVLTSEGLSAGCVVLTNMGNYKYFDASMNNCPVVDVNPTNLYSKLKTLILDYDSRKKIAQRGRPFIEQYRTNQLFAEKIIRASLGEKSPEEKIQPTFLRDHYKPENKEEIKIINKWNKFVRNEDWYRENIQSGDRDGLIF